ncbi:MAG: hypothetical protein ACRCZI_14000 [Cetobacterium sp.]
MDWTKLIPSLVGLIGLLLTAFNDQIMAWVMAHPAIALAMSQILTTIANLTKSPTQPSA